MRLAAVLGLWATLALAQSAPVPNLRTWSRQPLRPNADPQRSDAPLAVGSLQKPFVAKAWAAAHPGQRPPLLTCGPASHCWHRSGHGALGLSRALSVSCNAYFRCLATETRLEAIQSTLAQEGFQGQLTGPEAALGLPGPSPVVIRPSLLLEAYARLVREPWREGEEVRQQVLAGLRAAAHSGTASGLALGGCWAKTGTIPSSDGDPTALASQLSAMSNEGRDVVVYNCHISSSAHTTPILFPETENGLPDAYAVQLFRMSSPLPEAAQNLAGAHGIPVLPNSRSFMYNADAAAIIQLFDIGTRVNTEALR